MKPDYEKAYRCAEVLAALEDSATVFKTDGRHRNWPCLACLACGAVLLIAGLAQWLNLRIIP